MRLLRVAFKRLAAEPLVIAGVVATLAIGVAATALMFGLLDTLLLRPPPHLAEPNQVVRLFFAKNDPLLGRSIAPVSNYPTFAELRETRAPFSGVAAYALARSEIGQGTQAARGTVAFVSGEYFSLLGTRPEFGRFFGGAHDTESRPSDVAVLSDGFWRRQFGGDINVIGRPVPIGERSYTVIGVAPRLFTGVELQPVDAWVPLDDQSRPASAGLHWKEDRQSLWLSIVARLRSGVSRSSAGELATVALRRRNAETQSPDSLVEVLAASTVPGKSPSRPGAVRVALWLGGVAVLLLLLASANATALLFARALRRRRDIAIRIALGARTTDIAQTILIDAALLASLTVLSAFGLVWCTTRLVQRLLLPGIVWPDYVLAPRIGLATIGITLAAALIASYLPMRRVLRSDLSNAIGNGGNAGGVRPSRANLTLLSLQSALCTLLLFGAMLFARSLHRVETLDLGVDVDHTLMLSFDNSRQAMTEAGMEQSYGRMLATVSRIRQVDRAALAEASPYRFGRAMAPSTDEKTVEELWTGREVPYIVAVGSGFFAAVGARSLRGRDFRASDRFGAEPVIIINDPLARILWPGQDPVGKRLRLDDGTYATVVGVLKGVWKFSVLERNQLALYIPLAQDTARGPGALFLHVTGDPSGVRHQLRQAAAAVAPELPPPRIELMRDVADPEFRPWRLGATMLTSFGLFALVIATVGLYSLVSFASTNRRHEIGVRVALGAPRYRVFAVVVRSNLWAVACGILLGCLAAMYAARWTADLLYKTSPRDPALLVATAASLVVTSVLASVIPVLRETRRSPASVLRIE